MAKLIATFIVSACVGLGVAGCGPPAPPQRVNAILPENRAIRNRPAKGIFSVPGGEG